MQGAAVAFGAPETIPAASGSAGSPVPDMCNSSAERSWCQERCGQASRTSPPPCMV